MKTSSTIEVHSLFFKYMSNLVKVKRKVGFDTCIQTDFFATEAQRHRDKKYVFLKDFRTEHKGNQKENFTKPRRFSKVCFALHMTQNAELF